MSPVEKFDNGVRDGSGGTLEEWRRVYSWTAGSGLDIETWFACVPGTFKATVPQDGRNAYELGWSIAKFALGARDASVSFQ